MKFRTAALAGMALVILLTLAQWKHNDVSPALFYALLPGNVVSLLITGGHGGSPGQEAVAPWLGALTNIVAYSLSIFACGLLVRRRTA